MKVFIFLILCSFIVYINNSSCSEKTSASSSSDCKDLETSDSTSHCCYLSFKSSFGNGGECVEVIQSAYENIKDYISAMEKAVQIFDSNYSIKKLDCKSSYLTLSLFSLILFIL